MGRPMLVGTTSVELSDHLSTRLRAEPLRKLAQVLNAEFRSLPITAQRIVESMG
jgi:preprotein translocase subunit SecA